MFKLKLLAGQEYGLKDREKLIMKVQGEESMAANPYIRFQHLNSN
jgi:uncharacterized protein (UPF0218 family)